MLINCVVALARSSPVERVHNEPRRCLFFL